MDRAAVDLGKIGVNGIVKDLIPSETVSHAAVMSGNSVGGHPWLVLVKGGTRLELYQVIMRRRNVPEEMTRREMIQEKEILDKGNENGSADWTQDKHGHTQTATGPTRVLVAVSKLYGRVRSLQTISVFSTTQPNCNKYAIRIKKRNEKVPWGGLPLQSSSGYGLDGQGNDDHDFSHHQHNLKQENHCKVEQEKKYKMEQDFFEHDDDDGYEINYNDNDLDIFNGNQSDDENRDSQDNALMSTMMVLGFDEMKASVIGWNANSHSWDALQRFSFHAYLALREEEQQQQDQNQRASSKSKRGLGGKRIRHKRKRQAEDDGMDTSDYDDDNDDDDDDGGDYKDDMAEELGDKRLKNADNRGKRVGADDKSSAEKKQSRPTVYRKLEDDAPVIRIDPRSRAFAALAEKANLIFIAPIRQKALLSNALHLLQPAQAQATQIKKASQTNNIDNASEKNGDYAENKKPIINSAINNENGIENSSLSPRQQNDVTENNTRDSEGPQPMDMIQEHNEKQQEQQKEVEKLQKQGELERLGVSKSVLLGMPPQKLVADDDIFLIYLKNFGILNVKDYTFLGGQYNPTLVVLYEKERTWSGRLALKKDTCALAAISLNPLRKLRQDHQSSKDAGLTGAITARNDQDEEADPSDFLSGFNRHNGLQNQEMEDCVLLWKVEQLPSECFKILAVPDDIDTNIRKFSRPFAKTKSWPSTGFLLFSTHLIMLFHHGVLQSAISGTKYGDDYVTRQGHLFAKVTTKTESPMTFDACHAAFVKYDESLEDKNNENRANTQKRKSSCKEYYVSMSLKNKELYLVSFLGDHLQMFRTGYTTSALALISFPQNYLFVAAVGNSVMLNLKRDKVKIPNPVTTVVKEKKFEDRQTNHIKNFTMKESRNSPSPSSKSEESLESIEREEYFSIFGHTARGDFNNKPHVMSSGATTTLSQKFLQSATISRTTWNVKVEDSFQTIGTFHDIAVAKSDNTSNLYDLVVAAGDGDEGCLALYQRSIRGIEFTRFQLPQCENIWTLKDRSIHEASEHALNAQNLVIQARNEKIKASNQAKLEEIGKIVKDKMDADPNLNREDAEKEARETVDCLEEESPLLRFDHNQRHLHDYVLLSTSSKTMVLAAGSQINEIDDSEFITEKPTIAAGNVLQDHGIVQVLDDGIRLLKGKTFVQDYELPHDAKILSAQICDPYVSLYLSNGIVIILKVSHNIRQPDNESSLNTAHGSENNNMSNGGDGSHPMLGIEIAFETTIKDHGVISTACLYKGPFANSLFDPPPNLNKAYYFKTYGDHGMVQQNILPISQYQGQLLLDKEDWLIEEEWSLYGAPSILEKSKQELLIESASNSIGHLLCTVTQEGVLVLYQMPSFAPIFSNGRVFLGPSLIKDEMESQNSSAMINMQTVPRSFKVAEISLVKIEGLKNTGDVFTVLLLVRLPNDEVLVYKAFVVPDEQYSESVYGRSRIRFVLATRQAFPSSGPLNDYQLLKPRINNFRSVSSRSGLFISGNEPCFVFAEDGHPFVYPFSGECFPKSRKQESTLAFCEFNNINCPKGFMIALSSGDIVIGILPDIDNISFRGPWSVRKIPIHANAQRVAYNGPTNSFGVLVSWEEPITRFEKKRITQLDAPNAENEEDEDNPNLAGEQQPEDDPDFDENAERYPQIYEEYHEVRMYRPDNWEIIEKYPLKNREVGLCISSMIVDVYKVSTDGMQQGRGADAAPSLFASSVKLKAKNMVVVGTGYLKGEDASSRGRLLFFEVSKQEGFTEGGAFRAYQVQLIAEKELKGPVSAVASLEGYVVVGAGPKIEVYKLVEDEIVCCSFAFGHLLCVSIATIKQYILAADMFKSISFMYWRDRNKSTNFLARDYDPLHTYANEFLIDGEELSIITSDHKGNLQLFDFVSPSVPESQGGTRLLATGGYHVGSRVNKFQRVANDQDSAKHSLFFASVDGGVGVILPTKIDVYNKIAALNNKLLFSNAVSRVGCLNPKQFRAFQPEVATHQMYARRLADGQLLEELWALDSVKRKEILRQASLNLDTFAKELKDLVSVLGKF